MKKNLVGSIVALAVSLGILYGAVWIGSKAWAEGQKQKA